MKLSVMSTALAALFLLGFGCGKKPTEPTGPTVNLATLADSMVLIPAGTFMMGDLSGVYLRTHGESNETPAHKVTLRSFYMSATVCTKKMYYSVLGGSSTENEYTPIDGVNWYTAVRFCNARSIKEGLATAYDTTNADSTKWTCDITKTGYRLPTEAEYEYACRAGTTSDYYWGWDSTAETVDDWHSYAWGDINTPSTNGIQRPMIVAQKIPNRWGLYDMVGNVCEWCNDNYGPYDSISKQNPTGPTTGNGKVLRGISCQAGSRITMWSSYRIGQNAFAVEGGLFDSVGFRVVRTVE